MKVPRRLLIQIPAFNEEGQIGAVLNSLPHRIDGVDHIQVLVVNDGSTDRTVAIAKEWGANVLDLPQHRGLAQAFLLGIAECVRLGADWIVTIDADHQYDASYVADLLLPLQSQHADVSLGVRPRSNPNYTWGTQILHWVGCQVMGLASGQPLQDPPSGFRGYTRTAAQRLTVHDRFTYTMETLIQLRPKGLRLAEVPVEVFSVRRPSRLFGSVPEYLARSARTIARCTLHYRPRFSALCTLVLVATGWGITTRWSFFVALLPWLVLSGLCVFLWTSRSVLFGVRRLAPILSSTRPT